MILPFSFTLLPSSSAQEQLEAERSENVSRVQREIIAHRSVAEVQKHMIDERDDRQDGVKNEKIPHSLFSVPQLKTETIFQRPA